MSQLRATGEAALEMYRGESGFTNEGYENEAINAIKEMMARLEAMAQQVSCLPAASRRFWLVDDAAVGGWSIASSGVRTCVPISTCMRLRPA